MGLSIFRRKNLWKTDPKWDKVAAPFSPVPRQLEQYPRWISGSVRILIGQHSTADSRGGSRAAVLNFSSNSCYLLQGSCDGVGHLEFHRARPCFLSFTHSNLHSTVCGGGELRAGSERHPVADRRIHASSHAAS